MCQSVNLFWKKAVQNVGCVSAFFVADSKIIYGFNFVVPLNVVFATFSLVCVLSLRESTCETRKSVFYFTSTCYLKTSSRPFYVCKELSTTSTGKWNFQSELLTALILDM